MDGNWSAGYAGLFSGPISSAAVQEFDDVKIGLDNSVAKDGDYDDGADSIIIDDNFNSATTSLAYDDNGNLTDDGIFQFVYDAWNRLVAVKTRYASGTTRTTIATYAYDGAMRRTKKTVATEWGREIVANDGGSTTVNFYYGAVDPPTPSTELGLSAPWSIFETRNGSNQTTSQYSWSTEFIDAILFADRQGDGSGNDVDPDVTAGGESANLDHRYFYHQDRNWNVTALTDYGSGVNGKTVERYGYTPYGLLTVLTGEVNGAEATSTTLISSVGNVFTEHTLVQDAESLLRQNRLRQMGPHLSRFIQRDSDVQQWLTHHYAYLDHRPLVLSDPAGLRPVQVKDDVLYPPPRDKITISCSGLSGSIGPSSGIESGPMHCDVQCQKGNGSGNIGGGCTGPKSKDVPQPGGPNGNGHPGWAGGPGKGPGPNDANRSYGETYTGPPGTCDCIQRMGDSLNQQPNKSYRNLTSNSNSALAEMLRCCGVPGSPPSDVWAPGWGEPVMNNDDQTVLLCPLR